MKLTITLQLLIIQQLTVIRLFVQELQFTLIACKTIYKNNKHL